MVVAPEDQSNSAIEEASQRYPSSLLKYYLARSGGVKFGEKILIYYV